MLTSVTFELSAEETPSNFTSSGRFLTPPPRPSLAPPPDPDAPAVGPVPDALVLGWKFRK